MIDAASLATLVVKVTVVISLGLLCLRLATRQSAAFRHVIASTTLAASALVPLSAAWFPPMSVVLKTRQIQESVALSTPTSAALPRAASPALPDSRPALSTLLLIGWAVGASVFLIPSLAGGYQSRRIRRQGQAWRVTETAVPTWRGLRRRQIPVLLHGGLSSPVACGVFSAVVALPRASTAWHQADIERALVHELAHLQRADVLVQAMARVVCAAYWFHPLVWICWRRLRLEAERACDDAVLSRFEAADYASQLVRIARGVTGNVASAGLLTMARAGELTTRIEAILDPAQCRCSPRTRRALPPVLLGVAFAAWLGCITPTTVYAVREASSSAARFAAASIRESAATESMMLVRHPDGSVRITAATLPVLLRLAYGVQHYAIVDAPAWMAAVRYDIEATPAKPAPPEVTRSMLRVLLAERFGLRVAHESRSQRVIVVGLPTHAWGLQPPTRCTSALVRASTSPPGALPRCGFQVGPGLIEATAVDAEALAATLSTALGARVVVEPARPGSFDMRLQWPITDGDASPLIEALRTQVGATVSQHERRMPVLAVQSVHRPT